MDFSVPFLAAMVALLMGSVHSLGATFGRTGFHSLPDDYVLVRVQVAVLGG